MALAELLAILALSPVVLLLVFLWAWSWRWRKHVWADIELNTGQVIRKRFKPDKDGVIWTGWGHYFTSPAAMRQGPRRLPLYRFRQDDILPIRYDMKKVVSDNPGKGKVTYVANAERVLIPAQAMAVFMKQKLFADAYTKNIGSMILLLLGFGVMALLIIGLYIRK